MGWKQDLVVLFCTLNWAQTEDLLKRKAGGFGSFCTKIALSPALTELREVSEPPPKAAAP